MKKYLLLFALWLACTASLQAAGGSVLVVHLRSGSQVGYALSERPRVSYSDDEVVFATPSETVFFLRSEVQKMTFGEATGISDVTLSAECTRPMFSLGDNELSVFNLAPASSVGVYGVNGQRYGSSTAGSDGNATVSLPSSEKVFIVKTSVTTFKVLKK